MVHPDSLSSITRLASLPSPAPDWTMGAVLVVPMSREIPKISNTLATKNPLGDPMDLDADLQERFDAARPPSPAITSFRFFRRFAIHLLGVALVATAITAVTTCLTVWISTLPANTPVSLSLVFRSWLRIIEFNACIWLCVFVLGALATIINSVRPRS